MKITSSIQFILNIIYFVYLWLGMHVIVYNSLGTYSTVPKIGISKRCNYQMNLTKYY